MSLHELNCDESTRQDIERLSQLINGYGNAVVALSGGVDSAVVAAVAFRTLDSRAVALTGVGQAVSQAELVDCRRIVEQIGIRHVLVDTNEINDPDYVRNDRNRCYFCKTTLYRTLAAWAQQFGFSTLVSGTNHDDLADYRPGLRAASDFNVQSPLAELGLGKVRVRAIARALSLEVAGKPSSPCLASRIAYGQPVTSTNLRRVERVEAFLHALGFHDVRARVHSEQLLRLELHERDWERMLDPVLRERVDQFAKESGFVFVTMDLMGRQSGSLNRMLPVLG